MPWATEARRLLVPFRGLAFVALLGLLAMARPAWAGPEALGSDEAKQCALTTLTSLSKLVEISGPRRGWVGSLNLAVTSSGIRGLATVWAADDEPEGGGVASGARLEFLTLGMSPLTRDPTEPPTPKVGFWRWENTDLVASRDDLDYLVLRSRDTGASCRVDRVTFRHLCLTNFAGDSDTLQISRTDIEGFRSPSCVVPAGGDDAYLDQVILLALRGAVWPQPGSPSGADVFLLPADGPGVRALILREHARNADRFLVARVTVRNEEILEIEILPELSSLDRPARLAVFPVGPSGPSARKELDRVTWDGEGGGILSLRVSWRDLFETGPG